MTMLRETKKAVESSSKSASVVAAAQQQQPNRVRRDTSGSSACQFLSHAYIDNVDDHDYYYNDNGGNDNHHDRCRTSPARPGIATNNNSTNSTNNNTNTNTNTNNNTKKDVLHSTTLGTNASIPHTQIQSSGPPSGSRPLEFPAPTVDRSMTISANVLDHRTNTVFRATSILMRKPVHAKGCLGRTAGVGGMGNNLTTMATGGGGNIGNGKVPNPASEHGAAGTNPGGGHPHPHHHHSRTNSGNSIHSWHSPITSTASLSSGVEQQQHQCNSNATQQQQKQQQTHHHHHHHHHHHKRTLSSNSTQQQLQQQQQQSQNLPPCDQECDLPNVAYCVRRKICDTTYGSVRLCVVMKRRGRNVFGGGGGGAVTGNDNGWNTGNTAAGGEPAWETTDEMVAIKVVNWSKLQSLRGRHLEDPIKELAAMQLLGNYHPNVISLSDSLQDETHLYCIFPYISGGDLYSRVWEDMRKSPNGRIGEEKARMWFRQILSGLSHLQKKGVCHRDLCMENIMVDEFDNVQLIDFGLCLRVPYADPNNRHLVTDVSANTVRRLMKAQGQGGKWQYMAPEVAMRQETFDGFAIDLWATGIVLFEFLIGKKPFSMPDAVDKNFHSISVEGDLAGLLLKKGVELDGQAVDLLQNMLWRDPAKRLTLAEVVDHPWVRCGYEGDKKKRLHSVDDSSLRWFLDSNHIVDVGSCSNLVPNRLRIFSCSSVDSIQEEIEKADDATADETKSYSSISPPTIPLCSAPYHESDESLAESGYKADMQADASSGPGPNSTVLDAEMLDKLDELYAKKSKKNRLTSCLNPSKWWRAGKRSTSSMSTVSEGRVSPTNNKEVNNVVHGDGAMC